MDAFVSRFFSGMGAAFIIPPMMAFVADITSYEGRGRGMGLLGASMSLGFMIGPGIGGFLSKISLQFPFYVAAAASVFAAILSIFTLPNPNRSAYRTGLEKKNRKHFQTY